MTSIDSPVSRPPSNTTPCPTNLLTLPYELRRAIFCYYFTAEGGYAFNAESEQLTTADGSLIELSLMYTCRSIADETKYLPFTLNSVTFSTMLRDDLENIWLKPWAMPDSSVLRRIGQLFGDGAAWQQLGDWYPGCTTSDMDSEAEDQEASWLFREKFRFSAASVAIWFLERLPNEARRQFRNVILREDHVSLHSPECHAHGLIPFCQENPRLHIERRISLFQNAFHHVPGLRRLTRLVEKTNDEDIPLKTRWITRNLYGWLSEALAAVDAGMPETSFTLVLDGDPDINTCSDIFQQVVHRDIACERAYQKRQAEDGSPTHDRYPVCEFVPEGFSEAIDHLLRQTSILRCNFHPGASWDPDKLAEELSPIPLDRWKDHDSCTKPKVIYLSPCLPEWRDLLLESFSQSPS